MSNIVDPGYSRWLILLKEEYREAQIKASLRVNEQLLRFYYHVGEEISKRGYESSYGSKFYEKLSADIRKELPDATGFSPTSLHYMRWFYDRYSPLFENLRQLAVEFDSDVTNLTKVSSNEPNLRQLAVELFSIPWGHHQIIIGKCPSLEESVFYVHETAANGWSRAVLSNFIKNGLFSRQGKAVTNFAGVLPEGASDLAQQLTKDPYDFNFLTLDKKYKEKNLKDALIDNIESFLLELGSGFAFLGREVRLEVGEKEKFMDMLFYNRRLRCYVVVEVKVEDLDSENLGQIGLYVSEVNRQLKKEEDNPTIGLLVVAKKDELFAKYALNMMSVPIGIAEYKLTNLLPEELQSDLPSIEEIEEGIKR
ncbi:MAG: DUF1016 family protein [Bacilli bacterium]|nr:DUF1016 family protein [Bacilli bacterium]